ncbi:MAG: hypothetical protein VB143_07325 [Burkholderia sp.]
MNKGTTSSSRLICATTPLQHHADSAGAHLRRGLRLGLLLYIAFGL